MKRSAIVWFRNDLRMGDNPALNAAIRAYDEVIPVFIHDPQSESPWTPGEASNWWLHHSLESLALRFQELGNQLTIRRRSSLAALRQLIDETSATAVFWNRRYEPAVVARDTEIKSALSESGIHAESHNGSLLNEPWEVRNKSGSPFKVFTPFWRHCVSRDVSRPISPPKAVSGPSRRPSSLALDELKLLPVIAWSEGIAAAWEPGESAAAKGLQRFLKKAFPDYARARDLPDTPGTSRLSPHLHFGEISPRQIWHGLRAYAGKTGGSEKDWRGSQFLAEVGWREFAHHLLHHFPQTPEAPLRPEFARFPWRENQAGLRAWQRGETGYPIVDAGMRELWATGWMHNRVRMVVASFLVKDLLIDWREGARWFWDTLVDADLASNTLGWQWTAGCGADAAPFFRIFNPVSQGEKFDCDGNYVRRWVPELAALPKRWIHQPWNAPDTLRNRLSYPEPVVSHAIAREVALESFQRIKKSAA